MLPEKEEECLCWWVLAEEPNSTFWDLLRSVFLWGDSILVNYVVSCYWSALLVTGLLSRPMGYRAKGMLSNWYKWRKQIFKLLFVLFLSFKLGVEKVVTAPLKSWCTGFGYQNNMRRSRCLGQSGQEALELVFYHGPCMCLMWYLVLS